VKKAGKDVAHLEQQSLQSIKPLVVHDSGKGDINVEQLQMLMDRIGLTKEDLLVGTGSPPKSQCVDEW
jgi:hypothetical protein